jgi:transposase-like protein
LRALYAKSVKATHAALPHRSRAAVFHRVRVLGLAVRRHWTADEDQFLRSEWQEATLDQIARRLGRGRYAVYERVGQLELPRGVPQGCESVSAAAARCGYTGASFRRILAAMGIKTKRIQTFHRGTRARKGAAKRFVDSMDADDAVQAWLASEIVHPAARARGISSSTLRDWLKEAGVARKGARGTSWRVPSVVIDQIVAERRDPPTEGTESLREAELRVRISRETLRIWLRDGGLLPMKKKPYVLACAAVDAVVADRMARPGSRCRRREAQEAAA